MRQSKKDWLKNYIQFYKEDQQIFVLILTLQK
jgi:hypothetical protein